MINNIWEAIIKDSNIPKFRGNLYYWGSGDSEIPNKVHQNPTAINTIPNHVRPLVVAFNYKI